ncbi:MAG: LysR family transcriptional regulator [Pseudomonas sp.]|jgi:DNA-binding transcriptional LysR family regulator|uniref:LysR family transcriptional regulator n=1 Tax=Pseudomonadaceae TaxID=135621 RepID=UPI0005360C38|nr:MULTISPECIES: LysR family transcriptional regulator [Pseudomonadaceae]AZZ44961.1 LysR family transcriptional regulator [Pseudomonadaceae bacterium SI-3]MAL35237.1 LysR family transcriptional regulator [Pseudomonas sp.]MBU0950697.1 LysR family transcriptional regulator [Gammaproteobacteria bacterium]BAP80087.1 transcriptional regulator [Pseudomonas sp. MT-1]KJJ61892.1 LysR family transcriptional regulator [Pseudomonas sp. 10B238]|tara:strand:+ start:81 stop:1025 length:945 start_codon:yes stop_codon:yes gene_type:complete
MSRRLRIHSPAIHYFDMVRRCQSIREAARRLNVASSAVNRQILKLEAEIGSPLFERLPAGLRLTAAGEVFARHVLVVLQDAARASSELDALQGLRTGHVEIATVSGVTVDLLPSVLEGMTARYPHITVGVTSLGSQAIPEAVTSGQADIGIAFALRRTADLQQLGVGHFRLGAIVPANHPLAGRREVSFSTCAEHRLILAKSDLSIHHLLAPVLARTRSPQKAALETSSVELAAQMAKRGAGIAFQTRIGIEAELSTGTLVHLPLNDNGQVLSDLGVYVRSSRYLPVAVDAFVRALCEEITRREQYERAETECT